MKLNLFEFTTVNSPIRKFIQSQIEIKGFLGVPNYVKGGKVLEIGCGSGYGAKLIDKYFKPKEIIGIDMDEKMIRLANKNKLPNTIFKVGDATKLDFKDSSLDGIFIFVVLRHIPNWKKALDEFFNYLEKLGFKTIKKQVYRPLDLTSRFVFIGRK